MMKKQIISFYTLLCAGLLALSAPAMAERWFDIEVLIFKRNQTDSVTENWDQQRQQLDITTNAPLLAPLLNCQTANCQEPLALEHIPVVINGQNWPVTGSTKRRILAASQLNLTQQRKTLERHAAFTPLLHLAWREVVAPRNRAQYYQVMAGDKLDNLTPGSFDMKQQTRWEMEGGIKIFLQHYLFIEPQLILNEMAETQSVDSPSPVTIDSESVITLGEPVQKADNLITLDNPDNGNVISIPLNEPGSMQEPQQWPESATSQTPLISYKMDQSRRVRSGEIHYFDHPKFGILVQIRKGPAG